MRRTSPKQPPRSGSSGSKTPSPEFCFQCSKALRNHPSVLFVEEEVGRVFCSENCIVSCFTPEIKDLERDYFQRLDDSDLASEERSALADLRWKTLESPSEVWCVKTSAGDYRYSLIRPYQVEGKKVWSICLTLMLRGQPSFLYLSLVTRLPAVVNAYRAGQEVDRAHLEQQRESIEEVSREDYEESQSASWEASDEASELEALLEQKLEQVEREGASRDSETNTPEYKTQKGPQTKGREKTMDRLSKQGFQKDIPVDEYANFEECLEETLESPDEVWAQAPVQDQDESSDSARLFHFIKNYWDGEELYWYLIVARETQDQEQLEIIDAFPTRQQNVVDQYRQGEKESLSYETVSGDDRLLH